MKSAISSINRGNREIEPPANIDGLFMLPTLLSKEGQREHGYLYWEFKPIKEKYRERLGGRWQTNMGHPETSGRI